MIHGRKTVSLAAGKGKNMFEVHVQKENGDYSTIQEAIEAVPYGEKATIYIGKGKYHEKLFCEKSDITFLGEGIDETIIDYDDGAFDVMPDGSKRGTFRSYTAFFGGKRVTVRNMTIANTAGDGSLRGQALAVYADADHCLFENVKMTGHQDTLFCAPLPLTERQKNGFMGPRVLAPRKLTKQLYRNCEIYGDVDFIFGGADAVFEDCTVVCNNREKNVRQNEDRESDGVRFINGYITAACGSKDNLGFVFKNCIIRGEEGCRGETVFLGRPWRDEARTVFIDCKMDRSIAKERFSGWGAVDKDQPDTYYGEKGSIYLDTKEPIPLDNNNKFVKDISDEFAADLSQKVDDLISEMEL
ncbi:pectinesterase family protein [Butyrivibrio sp. VCB2006]|uniref:pectinesterase family protein n=1 Tax=Butyrivibrio sp. VCB2006 TaxID=1280679 RepID=UPI000425C7BF|nr:pectinesterase family protein [Butyrivibrio sp. VCB2006]